jgi:hypothetical protein
MTVNIVQRPSRTTYVPAIGATGSTTTYTINTVGGGGGGSGSVLTTSGWSVQQSPTVAILNSLDITPRDNAEAVIKTNHNKINLDNFYENVCEAICLIPKNVELHSEFPILADAYEKYEAARKKWEMNIDKELRDAYNEYQALKAIVTTK